MRSRLDSIANWTAVARTARYRSKELAQNVEVSTRQLERFFRTSQSIAPGEWLDRLLINDAIPLLESGKPVQEVAAILGFSSASNFTRTFRRITGGIPRHFASTASMPKPHGA